MDSDDAVEDRMSDEVTTPSSDGPSLTDDAEEERRLRKIRQEAFDAKVKSLGSDIDVYIFDERIRNTKSNVAGRVEKFVKQTSENGSLREALELSVLHQPEPGTSSSDGYALNTTTGFMAQERRISLAFRLHRKKFPSTIWTCCKACCFATIAIDPEKFLVSDEVMRIHEQAEKHHKEIESLSMVIDKHRKGVGTSNISFTASSRSEREALSEDEEGGQRQRALKRLANFVAQVLPFLRGQGRALSGIDIPNTKLCTEAIRCLLSISRNFLYYRRTNVMRDASNGELLDCLVDNAGLRLRRHRVLRDRVGFPPIEHLNTFGCGCDVPCFAEVPEMQLLAEYEEFSQLSQELKPRHKENQYLLERMFCPLSNSTVRICNRALASLYTVSEYLIAEVRRVLNVICNDPLLESREMLKDSTSRYKYSRKHPINRYPDEQRAKIERGLDLILRADPAGGRDGWICGVYSPEINTQEKLHAVLMKEIGSSDDGFSWDLSPSTLRRMLKEYMRRRNYKAISFTQADHNACPTCKTLHYAVLQYHHEAKIMQQEIAEMENRIRRAGGRGEAAMKKKLDDLKEKFRLKTIQEDQSNEDMQVHNDRDRRIQQFVKTLTDYFRDAERKKQEKFAELPAKHQALLKSMPVKWRSRSGFRV